MSTTNELFTQAEMALASYSTLAAGMSGDVYSIALQDSGRGLSTSQATLFASTYTVVTQYNNASNGLSATVFADANGQKFLAIRGTEFGLTDLLTDAIDIALLGTPEYQDQYASLKAKVTEWIGNGTLPSSFTVSGHSLGGFLAGALTLDFDNVSYAYLYNAPGVGGVGSSLAHGLQALLGLEEQPSLNLSMVSNLRANAGISPISGLGIAWGDPISIFIEDQFASDVENPPAARNHSQQTLTDALAVYSLLAQLDPALTIDKITEFLHAASAENNRSLESTLDALRFTLGQLGDTTTDYREAFYAHLYALQDSTAFTALAGKVSLLHSSY